MLALCVGSATCKDDDLAQAARLGISQAAGWTVIAVNHAALHWPGELPHWASFHANFFPRWAAERAALGLPAAGQLWTGTRRLIPQAMDIKQVGNWGGSSGLLAVSVAHGLGAHAIVCCGIPLDYQQGHFDSPDKLWRDAANYRKGWVSHKAEMGNFVKSVSGWTAELLGAPEEQWLARAVQREQSLVAEGVI
jgi:hypothetical protein